MDVRTSVVGYTARWCCLVRLSFSFTISSVSFHTVAVSHPSSFSVCLPQPEKHPARSLPPSRSSRSLLEGLRVSRRASWWLHRWLLASLEGSQESVPPYPPPCPRGSRNSLGNRFTSSSPLPLLRHGAPSRPSAVLA